MMNLLDFTIIYLACGSSFGVYYFLNHKQSFSKLISNSFLTTIFWIPFAVKLLRKVVTNKLNKRNSLKFSSSVQEINNLQKSFEKFLPSNSKTISLFEFREVLERYVGLSQSINTNFQSPTDREIRIYQITENKNPEISAICLNRRNRQKLFLHQIKAREDFFNLLRSLLEIVKEKDFLINISFDLIGLLQDEKANVQLKGIVKNLSQTTQDSNVTYSETDLWNLQEPQLKTKQTPLILQTLTATVNPLKKD